jgi:hypothetical protein
MRMRGRMKRAAVAMSALFSVFCPISLLGVVLPSSSVSLPPKVIDELATPVHRTFLFVSDIRLLSVGKDRTDIVVMGQKKDRNWTTQVFTVKKDHLVLKWDRMRLAGTEFEGTGSHTMQLTVLNDDFRLQNGDYWLTVQSCAPHECGEGVGGFAVYLGSSGKIWKAKVDETFEKTSNHRRYDVQWSPDNDTSEEGKAMRQVLETTICQDALFIERDNLPFPCAATKQ